MIDRLWSFMVGLVFVVFALYLIGSKSTGEHLLGWVFLVVGALLVVARLVLRSLLRRRAMATGKPSVTVTVIVDDGKPSK